MEPKQSQPQVQDSHTDASTQQPLRFRRFYQQIAPLWKKPSTRVAATTIFSFLAVSLFGWYAIRPTVQTILLLRREIDDKTLLNQQMEDKITRLIEARALYEQVSDQLPLVYAADPEEPQAVDLTIQVKNLAALTDASISAVQVQTVPLSGTEATPGAKLLTEQTYEYEMTVTVAGTYGQLRSFLEGILDMRRMVTVNVMSIRPAASTVPGLGQTLQMILKLKAYYSPPM